MAVKKTRTKAAKPVAKKKTVAKKVAAPVKKATAIKEPLTKTQMMTHIAESTELSKKQVSAVFEELALLVERCVKPRGAGSFTLPGLLKIVTIKKPARKARKGINPFTGEEAVFKAKPAHTVVKVRALKKLKDMAG
jgi:nucleoid DNA-binding protein